MRFQSFLLLYFLMLPGFGIAQWSEQEILIMNDSIKLPGTLSISSELKQQPLAIFIQGSGNPDRDGNQLQVNVKANYLKMLSDSLNHEGIAVFRFDKRNVTPENIKFILRKYTFEDLVSDAKQVIDHFSNDKRFSSITVIGHSQGSLVGMLAINENVDNYISLAGLGQSVDKAMCWQLNNQMSGLGDTATEHFKELAETGTIKQVNPLLLSIFAPQNYDFLKSYIGYDPAEVIKELRIPVLVMNGDKDIQVTVEDAQILHAANPGSQLEIIPNMNHVLKQVDKDEDNMKSYYSPDFPLANGVIESIVKFIKD